MLDLLKNYCNWFLKSSKWTKNLLQFFICYWKNFRNLSSLLRSLTYLSLLNSFLFLSRFSVSLKSLDNYFFGWFAYKSLLSRFSVLISYSIWSSNHFSISSRFPCFSGSRSRVRVQVLEVAFNDCFSISLQYY